MSMNLLKLYTNVCIYLGAFLRKRVSKFHELLKGLRDVSGTEMAES